MTSITVTPSRQRQRRNQSNPLSEITAADQTPSGISGVVARVSELAGLELIHAHRLRHTAAMNVLAAGGTLTEAKELLGHVYTVTTMIYAKVDLASLRELVVPFGQVPR